MKIVKIKFLGEEYDIRCQDNEVEKIKILESRLKNRVNQYSKKNHNFTDTHKLLIVALSLEDQVNDLIANQKKLNEIISNIEKNNEKLLKYNDDDRNDFLIRLESISTKIKFILNKISEKKDE